MKVSKLIKLLKEIDNNSNVCEEVKVNKFVMIWNNSLYFDFDNIKNVFSKDELYNIFSVEYGLKELIINDGFESKVYNLNDGIDELIECGSMRECVKLKIGDDFVSVSIIEIIEKIVVVE